MAITSLISVLHDKAEYSLYYRASANNLDYSVILATVTATGVDGDTVYLSLVLTDTNRIICTKSVPLMSGKAQFLISLRQDGNDADGIYRARKGLYQLVASTMPNSMGLITSSDMFIISPACATELREVWLRGVQLVDERNPTPVVQGLTGVAGLATRDVQRGGYPLNWVVATRVLSWDGGPGIIVPTTGFPYQATLWPQTLDQTATFTIDPASMPSSDTLGYMMVDYAQLDDNMLRAHLASALGAVESIVNIPLEPTLAVTGLLKAKYPYADRTISTPTYRPQRSISRPLGIQTVMRRIIAVHEVGGYYAGNAVLTIPNSTLQLDERNGIISLVVGNSTQYPAPTALGMGGLGYYGGGYGFGNNNIPNYWQVAATYGVDELGDGNEATARECIFRYAAISVLGLVGRARTDILAGESFSRDGANVSRQFTNGQYGVYSDLIMLHKDWLTQYGGKVLHDNISGREVTVAGM
jgi:hypothetical protein